MACGASKRKLRGSMIRVRCGVVCCAVACFAFTRGMRRAVHMATGALYRGVPSAQRETCAYVVEF